jgi:hypothetical protein
MTGQSDKRPGAFLIVLLAIGLLAVIALAFVFRGMVAATIVQPVAEFLWLAGLLFNSVPGFVWWGWLLIVVLVIAGKSLRGRRSASGTSRQVRHYREGPIMTWARQLHLARDSEYFRWRLAHEVARLALSLAAYRSGSSVTPRDLEQIASLGPPPDAAAYMAAGLGSPPQDVSRLPTSITGIRSWFAEVRDVRTHKTPLSAPPEDIIAFLEKELQHPHDG